MGAQRECADTETGYEYDACGDRDDLLVLVSVIGRCISIHRKFLGEAGIVLALGGDGICRFYIAAVVNGRLVVHVHIMHILLMLSLVLHPGQMNSGAERSGRSVCFPSGRRPVFQSSPRLLRCGRSPV